MRKEGPRLISATDIRREDVIQCDPGDYEIKVTMVLFRDSVKTVILEGMSELGEERRELSQAAEVRLVKPSPKREKPMPQRRPRDPRSYWSLSGYIDDGETFDIGPTVHLQTYEQGYAQLVHWMLNHDLDDDFVVGFEPTWADIYDDDEPILWAICVFTRGCALVLYRHRAGFE